MKRAFISFCLLCAGLGAAAQGVRFTNTPRRDPMREQMNKLANAVLAITSLYVDTVDNKKLVEGAINGMLSKLDPHSAYTNASETKKLTEPLAGSFEGIGVQFNMLEDTLVVIQPVPKGPSERVGIQAGDRIVSVADTAIAGVKMSKEEIMRRLRGPKGTIAHLKVVRLGIRDTLSFDVKRDKIPVNSVDAAYMVTPTIGLIRFNNFAETTPKEVLHALDTLKGQGMKDLIIDLQDNGGGYLQTAVYIVNDFLNKGEMIVYTEGRSSPRREYFADGSKDLFKGKVCVLINEYSASASEILSGAIQDQDRGIIVGRRSFGKGLVQRPLEFPDGSMIRLTIAHYYTPSGRCIQKPYTKGKKDDYAHDIENRFKNGEFTSADSIHFADSLKYYTLREHRTVYGGGGIMPDHFVPLDTTQYTKFHRQLSAKSYIINANLKYIDEHRKALKKQYKTFKDFNAQFEIPKEVIDGIIEKAAKDDIKPTDDDELERTIPYLRKQLKALVARDLWDMSEYFQVMNETNAIVTTAVRLMQE